MVAASALTQANLVREPDAATRQLVAAIFVGKFSALRIAHFGGP